MKIFDTHCHLGGDELKPHALELARRAFEGGVQGLALIAADAPSLRAVPEVRAEIARSFPALKVVHTAGIHPHEGEKTDAAIWDEVVRLAPAAEAIGETGLDYHYDFSDRDVQRKLFTQHIDLAVETKKPLVIHCREAAGDVLKLLDREDLRHHPRPGILHCFTEDVPTARELVKRNFFISFSGILTFKNAELLREAARWVPLDHLLIETDSPWLAPIPYRGKTNEPLFVREVFECLTKLRPEISREDLAEKLWQNSLRIFGVA